MHQWHNDIDPATGLRLGDVFAEFVATESAANGVAADDPGGHRRGAPAAGRELSVPPGCSGRTL